MQIVSYLIVIGLAILGGKLAQKVSMPAILGWLISGMILGPYVLNLMTNDMMSSNWYTILLLAVEIVVGIMLGSNLDFNRIKKYGSQIIRLTFSEMSATFVVVFLTFATIFYFMEISIIVALLIGAVATATAPAPPLTVVDEYNTDGPVTKTLLPMTVLNSIIVNILFFTLTSFLQSIFSDVSSSVLMTLTLMLFVPIIYGAVVGLLVGKLFSEENKASKNAWIFILATFVTILVAFFIDQVLYPEPMMNFLIIGIAYMSGVVNMVSDKIEEDIYTLFGSIQSVALLLLIINIAAPLDPTALMSAGILLVVYIIARFIGKYFGIFAAAKAMDMDENVQKYLGLVITPHAGISIVLAGVGANAMATIAPEYADIIQIIVPAAAVVNEVLALLISQKAYDWAGEVDAGSR